MNLNLFCFLGVEEELHDPAGHANLLHCNKAAAHRRVKLDTPLTDPRQRCRKQGRVTGEGPYLSPPGALT